MNQLCVVLAGSTEFSVRTTVSPRFTMIVGPGFDWDALENPQPVDMPPYSVKLFVSARAGTTAIADATNANVRVATQRAFPDRFIVHASGVARRLPRINVFRNYLDGMVNECAGDGNFRPARPREAFEPTNSCETGSYVRRSCPSLATPATE